MIAHGTRGAVAAGHELASDAALAVLRDGGNAVDAAVAAALVLTVVAPYACTLAGDLYLLVYDPKTKKVDGLNATGRSPAAATRDRFPDGTPSTGILSATVPGLLRGVADVLASFGTRGLRELLQPAIRYADGGFPVHRTLAKNTAERAELLRADAAASALFLPGGAPLAEGATFVQPELARILTAIAEQGVDAFYEGEIAEQFVAASTALGGLFTRDDLAAHASLWQAPISAPFYGHDVLTMPPNSFGPTLLLQLLDLEAAGIGATDPDGPEFVTRGFAARRSAYANVAEWIADPREGEARAREIVAAAVAAGRREPAGAVPSEARDRCTTNAIVVDEGGMAVSLIESISAPYGSGVVLDGTGIVLNNRMAGFSKEPVHANAVGPAKRPANTLAPCLVMRDGQLKMSVGTPGTVGQTCTLAQFLTRTLACGQGLEGAVAAPRWSVDFQGSLIVEDRMPEPLRGAAKVMPAGWISFGSIKAAAPTGDGLTAVADDRRAAAACAW